MSYFKAVAIKVVINGKYSEIHNDFGPIFSSKERAYQWWRSLPQASIPNCDRIAVMSLADIGQRTDEIPF